MLNSLKKVVLSVGCALALASTAFAQETAAAANTVPKLNIVWDCGKCEVNEKVIPLIEDFYRAEAAKRGLTVSDTETVDAKIHDFRQRPPGVRVMAGIMAGKDRLGLTLNYKSEEIVVKDYSANAMQGMNALCESVAKQAVGILADKK